MAATQSQGIALTGESQQPPVYALTLDQPWAELVRLGRKRVETRSHLTRHRGWLVIHASRKLSTTTLIREPFASLFRAWAPEDFPLQAIVAVVWLQDVVQMTAGNLPEDPDERAFGFYTPGRWMWQFSNLHALERPIPARGYQGLWRLGPELLATIQVQLPGWSAALNTSDPDGGMS